MKTNHLRKKNFDLSRHHDPSKILEKLSDGQLMYQDIAKTGLFGIPFIRAFNVHDKFARLQA